MYTVACRCYVQAVTAETALAGLRVKTCTNSPPSSGLGNTRHVTCTRDVKSLTGNFPHSTPAPTAYAHSNRRTDRVSSELFCGFFQHHRMNIRRPLPTGTLVFVLIVSMGEITLSSAKSCVNCKDDKKTFKRRDPETNVEIICDLCPPGFFMKEPCNVHQYSKCEVCPQGHYMTYWNHCEKCQFCSEVCNRKYEKVEHECSSTQRQTCICEAGYFKQGDLCRPHTQCPPGAGVVRNGTSTRDVRCGKCSPGSYNAFYDSVSRCRVHTNCTSLGLTEFKTGSRKTDAQCISNDIEFIRKDGTVGDSVVIIPNDRKREKKERRKSRKGKKVRARKGKKGRKDRKDRKERKERRRERNNRRE
ncbi:tumor necrosis factor receptor superfamily member 21-like [Glandiceps talaboti]